MTVFQPGDRVEIEDPTHDTSQFQLATVIERMTAGGALYGLPIPRIAPGARANLTLIDLDARFEVGAEGYASRSANCCFHGRTLQGKVLLTVAAWTVAHAAPMRTEATVTG